MGFQNPIVGGTALRIPAIQSPNYSAGTTGWIIKINGDAEFNNLTIRGTFVGQNFIINSAGIFLYSGTPAAGNMSGSWASAAGTDSFGNAYPAGLKIYGTLGTILLGALDGLFVSTGSSGATVTVNDGTIQFEAAPTDSSAALIIQNLITAHGSLYLQGGETVSADHAARLGVITSNGTPSAGNADTFPRANVTDANGTGTGYLYASGAVLKSNAIGDTAEVWQTPTFSGSWVTTGTLNGNATFRGLQYRKDAEDNVWILGAATTTAAGGSIFTLPAGYFNSSRRHLLPCYIFDSSAAAVVAGFAQVTETGIVNISATLSGVTIATGDQVFINGKFPLGNVA